MKTSLLLTLTMALSLPALAQDKVVIDENFLWKSVLDSPPTIQQLEASYLGSKFQNQNFKDNFNTQLEVNGYFAKTEERQLANFLPVTSPIHDYSIGVTKNTTMGMQLGARLYSKQTTNNFFAEANTTGVSASVALDLYKDFGGRVTKARMENMRLGEEFSKMDKDVRTKGFFSNVRRIYWGLVANNESLKLTKNLIAHSEKQVKEALKRFKSRVADEGEVAQYRSQLASRKAQLFYLEYQRENMVQQLKEFLPQYAGKNVVLGDYSIDQTINNVLACTVKIRSNKETPLDYTKMDELVQILRGQFSQEQTITKSYDQMDLKLMTNFDAIGKDQGFSKGFTNLAESSKPAFNVGLQITIPLGDNITESAEVKKQLDKRRYAAQIDSTLGKMNAYHEQLVRSIELLRKVVQNTKENTVHLEKSLKVSLKKYNQARINVQQLVQEQDMFLQSSLQEIDVKLQVINTLLDYFSVFTETPCQFNEFKS